MKTKFWSEGHCTDSLVEESIQMFVIKKTNEIIHQENAIVSINFTKNDL